MGNVPPQNQNKKHSTQKSSNQYSSFQRQMSNQRQKQNQNMSPLIVWNNSLKYAKDLTDLIYSDIKLNQWLGDLRSYMKKIRNKQTYQQHCRIILQYCLCDKIRAIQDQQKLLELFLFYKSKLQSSFFFDGEFSQNSLSYCEFKSTPQKLLYLYNWPNITAQYIEASMLQLSPQSFIALQELTNLIIQQQIFVQNELHFQKFIIHSKAVQNCFYYPWDVCQKIYKGEQKQHKQQRIRKIHQFKQIYINMAKAFLKFNNFQNAEFILRTLQDKKYELTTQQLTFYLKIKLCSMLTYDLNAFNFDFQTVQKQSSIQTFAIFFSMKSFSEINTLKRCYQIFDDKYKTFHKDLKDYSFSTKCPIQITLMSIEFQLLNQQDFLPSEFITKLKQSKCEIYRFQKKILQNLQKLKKHKQIACFQIVLNCSQILYSLGINMFIKQLMIFKEYEYDNQKKDGKSLHEMRFMAVACLKNMIGKYLIQDKQKIIKFSNRNLAVNKPTSLLQLCLYFQSELFCKKIIFNNQVHQIIFQHMLYFYRYDQIKQLLTEENIRTYHIQRELIQLIIRQNIQEMLKSDQTHSMSGSSSQKRSGSVFEKKIKDIKIQLSLLEDQNKLQNKMIQALFNILLQLQNYNIHLTKQQKQQINISLLYSLLEKYPQRIEIIDFDSLYKNIRVLHTYCDEPTLITNEYLKFKIELVNVAFKYNKSTLAQNILQGVLIYQPPWISSQLIKIFQKNSNINQKVINLAFQYCNKGEDLLFLLNFWKKNHEKQKLNSKESIGNYANLSKSLSFLQSSAQKFVITNSECIQCQCEQLYHNLISQMTFNYQILSERQYKLFFILLGTQPERAFYNLYKQRLDINIIEIVLKQAIKNKIIKFLFTLRNLYKVIHLIIHTQDKSIINFRKFKSLNVSQILNQNRKMPEETNFVLNSLHIKYKRIIQCLQLLQQPQNFLKMYLQIPKSFENPLYMFLYEQNYRKKFFLNLIQQPMGTNHIKILERVTSGLNIDIFNQSIRMLCDQVNANPDIQNYNEDDVQLFQHIILKLVIWTSDNLEKAKELVQSIVINIFSIKVLIYVLDALKSKQNFNNQKCYHIIITQNHLKILNSLANLQVNTEFHGLIPQTFFGKEVSFNNKSKIEKKFLKQNQKKILRRQLKDRNVLVVSKCMYFFYEMNFNIQCETLTLFLDSNQNSILKETIQQKLKLMEGV